MKKVYRKRVDLLLEILPYVLKDHRMALKGGTAINLFHRNFPRLSVDIDLCYLPLEDRTTSFENIHQILVEVKKTLESDLGLKVKEKNLLQTSKETKLFVSNKDTEVKIEPNFVLRGSLFPPTNIELSELASKEFEKSMTENFASIYLNRLGIQKN